MYRIQYLRERVYLIQVPTDHVVLLLDRCRERTVIHDFWEFPFVIRFSCS